MSLRRPKRSSIKPSLLEIDEDGKCSDETDQRQSAPHVTDDSQRLAGHTVAVRPVIRVLHQYSETSQVITATGNVRRVHCSITPVW